jgi:glycine/D-amino acid oxidase-like deaminating enzyme
MVATEELSENLVRATLPRLRTYHDNRRRSHFFSASPDGRRILIGGRTGNLGLDVKGLAAKLHGDLLYIFPDLAGVRLSHAWHGRCAAPVDAFPRFGELDGLYYALGYSFSGMAMGPHLGRKVAWRMLGRTEAAQSYFARPDFPRVPLVARTPFTMPIVTAYYGWADHPTALGRRM